MISVTASGGRPAEECEYVARLMRVCSCRRMGHFFEMDRVMKEKLVRGENFRSGTFMKVVNQLCF